jgi:hypothetical protein
MKLVSLSTGARKTSSCVNHAGFFGIDTGLGYAIAV